MCTCKNESIDKKYELTNEVMEYDGHILHRIKALKDFTIYFNINDKLYRYYVYKDDLGGWVESEKNLSQKGNCWVCNDSYVIGNAVVSGTSVIDSECLTICGNVNIIDSFIHESSDSFITNYTENNENSRSNEYLNICNSYIKCTNSYINASGKMDNISILCDKLRLECKHINLKRDNNSIKLKYGMYDDNNIKGDDISIICDLFEMNTITGGIHGNNIIIYNNVKIYENAVIDDNVYVSFDASLYMCGNSRIIDSKIYGNAKLQNFAYIENAVLYNCNLKDSITVASIRTFIDCDLDMCNNIHKKLIEECGLFPDADNTVTAYKFIRSNGKSIFRETFKYNLTPGSIVKDDTQLGLSFGNIKNIMEYPTISINDIFTNSGTNLILVKAKIDLDDINSIIHGNILCKKATILDSFDMRNKK